MDFILCSLPQLARLAKATSVASAKNIRYEFRMQYGTEESHFWKNEIVYTCTFTRYAGLQAARHSLLTS